MTKLLVISAALHVALFVLLPLLPMLGEEKLLGLEVYAVELVELPREVPRVEDDTERVSEPEPAPPERAPEEEVAIPEEPVRAPARRILKPPPKRPEKTLEERIAERLTKQDERRPAETPKKPEAPKLTGSRPRTVQLFPYSAYLTGLQGKITRNWKQPSARFAGGQPLTVRVSFRVLRGGSIQAVTLREGSGWPTVDQSAVQAVRDSAPFPTLPPDYAEKHLDVTIDFTVTQD